MHEALRLTVDARPLIANRDPASHERQQKRNANSDREQGQVCRKAMRPRSAGAGALRQPLLRAVLGLAVDFRTWQTLVRREELDY